MGTNPYIAAQRTAARHRRRAEGLWVRLGRIALGVLGALMVVWLVRPVFLGFLAEGGVSLDRGVAGIVLRAGLVLVGLAGMDLYGAVVRGPERDVLSLLPFDPVQVVTAAIRRVIASRWWTLPVAALALLPVGLEGSWPAYGALLAALTGLQLLAWPAAAVAHLLAVRIADDPAWAPILDLVRGSNPRESAAFMYAPGVLILATGVVLALASEAAAAAALGAVWGWVVLGVLPLLAVPPILLLPGLARRTWFRATAVLADIDARWAAVAQDDDEHLAVYLGWTVRFLPAPWRRFALLDLRHGWRGRRLWITGGWVAGFIAMAVGWSEAAAAARATPVTALGVAAVVSVALVLYRDESAFLRWWLPQPPVPRLGARAVVLALWASPVLLPPALGAAYLAGWAQAGLVLAGGAVALGLLVPLGLVAAPRGRLGVPLYVAGSLVVVGAVATGSAALAPGGSLAALVGA